MPHEVLERLSISKGSGQAPTYVKQALINLICQLCTMVEIDMEGERGWRSMWVNVTLNPAVWLLSL